MGKEVMFDYSKAAGSVSYTPLDVYKRQGEEVVFLSGEAVGGWTGYFCK